MIDGTKEGNDMYQRGRAKGTATEKGTSEKNMTS